LNTEIGPLNFKAPRIKCLNESYDAIVSSAPAPQTARLFGLSKGYLEYDPCTVALIEYGGTDLGRAREAYGRVLADPDGVLHSGFCENNKVGRIVGNKTVFIIEATARYSREVAGAPSDSYLPPLIKQHEELWCIPAKRRTAAFGIAWKQAHPRTNPSRFHPDLPPGAFICGDSRVESKVEKVWLNGQKVAQEVVRYLKKLS
jgi:predicted NAD/FAD-dependent oxidoreductase